jgi:hypothetical protein
VLVTYDPMITAPHCYCTRTVQYRCWGQGPNLTLQLQLQPRITTPPPACGPYDKHVTSSIATAFSITATSMPKKDGAATLTSVCSTATLTSGAAQQSVHVKTFSTIRVPSVGCRPPCTYPQKKHQSATESLSQRQHRTLANNPCKLQDSSCGHVPSSITAIQRSDCTLSETAAVQIHCDTRCTSGTCQHINKSTAHQ